MGSDVSVNYSIFAAENKSIVNMRKKICILMMLPAMAQAQTLEECQRAAEQNYPLIRQYGLIEKTTSLNVANIQKGWLPQVSASAQATLQSDVTAFPDEFQKLYQQMGITMEGLERDQYRVGFDVQQTVYDAGNIKSQKEQLEQGQVPEGLSPELMQQIQQGVNPETMKLLQRTMGMAA